MTKCVDTTKYQILTPADHDYKKYATEYGLFFNHVAVQRKGFRVEVLPLHYVKLTECGKHHVYLKDAAGV